MSRYTMNDLWYFSFSFRSLTKSVVVNNNARNKQANKNVSIIGQIPNIHCQNWWGWLTKYSSHELTTRFDYPIWIFSLIFLTHLVYLPIDYPTYLPIYLSTCLSACLPTYLPTYLLAFLLVCLPACLLVCLPACLPACCCFYWEKYNVSCTLPSSLFLSITVNFSVILPSSYLHH